MNFSLLILGLPLAVGYFLVRPLSRDLFVRWGIGAAAGYGLFTALSASVWLVTRSLSAATVVAVMVFAVGLMFSLRQQVAAAESVSRVDFYFFCGLTLLLQAVIGGLLFRQGGDLYTGFLAAYGDVPWHVANITAFADGQSFPPENPSVAGQPLVYPFFSAFFSAMIYAAGSSIEFSLVGIARILVPVAAVLIFVLARAMGGSAKAGRWASALFLCGGSTAGIFLIHQHFERSGLSWGRYFYQLPGLDFTGFGANPSGIEFVNPVLSFLLAQRNLLFALPIWISVLILISHPELSDRRRFLLAGVLTGILPLFHAHAFLALLPCLVTLSTERAREEIKLFGLGMLPLAIPTVGYYFLVSGPGGLMRLSPGFITGSHNPILYWLLNTGLIFPAAIWAAWKSTGTCRALLVSGLNLLLLANVVQFARWHWDNYKVALFAILLCLVGSVVVVIRTRAWAFGLFFVAALHGGAGFLDLYRVSSPWAAKMIEWDSDAISAAALIRSKTAPRSIILAAPVHNNVVALAGRISYLGFPGHVWSWGGDPWSKATSIEAYYRGGTDQLPEPHPDYVYFGPQEEGIAQGAVPPQTGSPLTVGETVMTTRRARLAEYRVGSSLTLRSDRKLPRLSR